MLVDEDDPPPNNPISEDMKNRTIASFENASPHGGQELNLVRCRGLTFALRNSLLDALDPMVPLLMQRDMFFYMLDGASVGAAANDKFTYEQIARLLEEVHTSPLSPVPAVAKLKEFWVSMPHGSHERSCGV